MITDNTMIKVSNRANGSVGYRLENNFHRTFEHGETKMIPFSELKALQYAPGGDYALKNLLTVDNKEALELLNMEVEPEYYYSEDKIRQILFEGSIDEFADFLDFAPEGRIEIAKRLAVAEQVPDTRKRKMLSEKTGVNIDKAIEINEYMAEDNEDAEEAAPKQRRVQVKEDAETDQAPKRRTAIPQYKVVNK